MHVRLNVKNIVNRAIAAAVALLFFVLIDLCAG
jgi:hypothetical protein